MRGKHGHIEFVEIVLRITPAHAGKTRRDYPENRGSEDHPRACGENMIKSEVVRVT